MVAEGRDQGTVVFPDAFRKFFLTATTAERARRRHAEYAARGEAIDLESVERDIRDRDARDGARAIAPMRPADDALVVDTTGLDLSEVVALILRAIGETDGGGRMTRPEGPGSRPTSDRSAPALAWYRLVQLVMGLLFIVCGGLRATGRRNVPGRGGAILVSNHLSHLDVFVLGLLLPRPLNYVARSTLFLPVLGTLIRSVGGFPIQREGMGASGLKETLQTDPGRRHRRPLPRGDAEPRRRDRRAEGGDRRPGRRGRKCRSSRRRSPGPSRPGRGIAPSPGPTRSASTTARRSCRRTSPGLSTEAVTALIRGRLLECQARARDGLARDLGGNCDWPGGPFPSRVRPLGAPAPKARGAGIPTPIRQPLSVAAPRVMRPRRDKESRHATSPDPPQGAPCLLAVLLSTSTGCIHNHYYGTNPPVCATTGPAGHHHPLRRRLRGPLAASRAGPSWPRPPRRPLRPRRSPPTRRPAHPGQPAPDGQSLVAEAGPRGGPGDHPRRGRPGRHIRAADRPSKPNSAIEAASAMPRRRTFRGARCLVTGASIGPGPRPGRAPGPRRRPRHPDRPIGRPPPRRGRRPDRRGVSPPRPSIPSPPT